jgi:hypothetical protein
MRRDGEMPEKSAIEQVEHLVQDNSGSPKSGEAGAACWCLGKQGCMWNKSLLIPKLRAQENHIGVEKRKHESVVPWSALLVRRSTGKAATPKVRHTPMKRLRDLP